MLIEPSAIQGFYERRRVFFVLGTLVVVAQTFAFWQMLGRYSVGSTGPLAFWIRPQWAPPLPPLFFVVAFPLTMSALVGWALLPRAQPAVGNARSRDQFLPRRALELQEPPNGRIPAELSEDQ